MTVTVSDVRIALNNISSDDLADVTIAQKIDDANRYLEEMSLTTASGPVYDKAVRDLAASWAYVVSELYQNIKIGPISAKRSIELVVKQLEKRANESLTTLAGTDVFIFETTELEDHRSDD